LSRYSEGAWQSLPLACRKKQSEEASDHWATSHGRCTSCDALIQGRNPVSTPAVSVTAATGMSLLNVLLVTYSFPQPGRSVLAAPAWHATFR